MRETLLQRNLNNLNKYGYIIAPGSDKVYYNCEFKILSKNCESFEI